MAGMSLSVFLAWSLLCVGFSGGLVYFIMRSHMNVRLARQREKLADLQATLTARKEFMAESLKHKEDSIRRQAMDEFLADIRVEERHYTREHRILFMTRKMLVRQERIFFRNIPLSNWVEQEMPIEEGVDTEKLAQAMSVFATTAMLADAGPEMGIGLGIRKLLR